MKLSHIVEMLFAESGQYIIGGPQDLKLNMQGIWDSFRHEIYNYQRYVPLIKRFNILVPSYFMYDFTFDMNNVGYSIGNAINYTVTESFPTGGDTTVITLPNTNVEPGTVVIKFNGTNVATDNADSGIITFSVDPDNYAGVINYITGVITIYTTNLMSANNGVSVNVTATYVNPGKPPHDILGVRPVGTMQVISVLAYWMSPMVRDIYNPQRLVEPRMFLWEYLNNQLYYSETGWLDVDCSYDYEIVETYNNSDSSCPCLEDVDIKLLEKDTNFYVLKQILLGRFLQVVGRSRRAFTFEDMPIRTDADKLVEEGTQMYKEARELLYKVHDWSISVRPG